MEADDDDDEKEREALKIQEAQRSPVASPVVSPVASPRSILKSPSFSQPPRPPTFYNMKAILVGNSGTGKTNIIERLAHGRFDPARVATEKYDKISMCVEIGTKNLVAHVTIWDTVGQETFGALPSMLYHDCHLCIIVYDITDRCTLEGALWWFRKCEEYAPPCIKEYTLPNVILVGNKSDLDHLREVTTEEGQMLAHTMNIPYFVEQSSVPRNTLNNFDGFFAACVATSIRNAGEVEARSTRNNQVQFDLVSAPRRANPASGLRVRGGEHYIVDNDKHHIYVDGSPDDKCNC